MPATKPSHLSRASNSDAKYSNLCEIRPNAIGLVVPVRSFSPSNNVRP